MNLTDAGTLARSLMTEHGVGSLSFAFHSPETQLPTTVGRTHLKVVTDNLKIPYMITISSDWVEVLSEDKVREIILHEIAHAKAGCTDNDHGPHWQRYAKMFGIPTHPKFKSTILPQSVKEFLNDCRA